MNLKRILLLLFVFSISGISNADNPVVTENLQPGSGEWRFDSPGHIHAHDVGGQILGYASAVSVGKNETLSLRISVSDPSKSYSVDIFRMGWYNGNGARLMMRTGANVGVTQPACPINTQTGMVACNWSNSLSITIPATWTSGIYKAMLNRSDGYQTSIVFVVRDDARVAEYIYKVPVLTYAAYNAFPVGTTNSKNLYDENSSGVTTVSGGTRAVKVSFDRPLNDSAEEWQAAWTADPNQTRWKAEHALIGWLERNGYDVTYITDVDAHTNGQRLLSSKLVISGGHDEYWSKNVFDHLEQARDQGVSLAFLGADAAFWQVRLEPSAAGTANRVVVCYKNPDIDPVTQPAEKTTAFRWMNRSEQSLIGIQYIGCCQSTGQSALVINAKTSIAQSLLQGTGLSDGSSMPGLVGYEVDTLYANELQPPARSGTYTAIANSPYNDPGNGAISTQSTVYQAPSGAWVFASGTMGWSLGLEHGAYENASLKLLTRNIFQLLTVGLNGGSLTSSSSSLNFGGQVANHTSAPATLTLSNTGTSVVTFGIIAVTGANAGDFIINSAASSCHSGGTLAAASSCSVVLNFIPSAPGARNANLSVASNAIAGPTNFPLTGTGTAATAIPYPPGTVALFAIALGYLGLRMRRR